MGLEYDPEVVPFVMWGNKEIKIEKTLFTEDFYLEKAKTELRENKENIDKGLEELRKLIKGEKDLVVPSDDDDFLKKFLRPCKFYSESAFRKMQAFYKFKRSHVSYSHDIMPSAIRLPFEHSCFTMLSPRDQHGRRILVAEIGERWNPRKLPLIELIRAMLLETEVAMMEPRTQVCGIVIVADMKGLSFSHVTQFNPFIAKAVIEYIQNCMPVRLKEIHLYNQPHIFKVLYTLFKPFVSEKLRSRLFFHGSNVQGLLQHIDGGCLMKKFGGSLPDDGLPGDVVWKLLHHYEEDFQVLNSYGYINSKKCNRS